MAIYDSNEAKPKAWKKTNEKMHRTGTETGIQTIQNASEQRKTHGTDNPHAMEIHITGKKKAIGTNSHTNMHEHRTRQSDDKNL